MGSDSTWVTCKHVMNGSADHVQMRPEKICLCSTCVQNINLVKTNEICILDEYHLERNLEGIKQIDGLWNFGKYRDRHGSFATEKRNRTERRSQIRRSVEDAFWDKRQERRDQYADRRTTDRRCA